MSEKKVVENTKEPLTSISLVNHLRRCGIEEGQTVFVQLSMSKLGWVIGGEETIIIALLNAVGESGTILINTNSSDNTDPSGWENPPIPKRWWPIVRENMPAYNPLTTPSQRVGRVPDLFRNWPGVLRSSHPALSLAAHGPNAEFLISDHDLHQDTGENSPIGKLYQLDGHVMLIGVDHDSNSSLHLAESRASYPGKKNIINGSAMMVNGKREWVTYKSQIDDDKDFVEIGKAFERNEKISIQHINNAEVRFFKQRALVDFAVDWMEANRDFTK